MSNSKSTARAVAASFLLAALAACGGGGGGDETTPASSPAKTQSTRATVVMYGDSVQLGVNDTNIAGFARPLLSDVADLRVSAVGGSIAYNLAEGVGVDQWPPGLLKTKQADIVSANFGINDTYGLDLYEQYLREIVSSAQGAGSVVILQTPNPVTSDLHGDVSQRAAVMRTVAAATGAVLCDHERDAIEHGLQHEVREPDGIGAHPNLVQYERMGVLFAGCVRQALAQLK